MKAYLTAGVAAKLLGVTPRTIAKWIDSGQLAGHRIPSGTPGKMGPRRTTLEDLRKFAEKHGLPLLLPEDKAA